MSSMVSRRPDVASDAGSPGSPMNHLNDAFWMSIRLGTSRIFSSLENVLRLRGEVVSGNANASRGASRGSIWRGRGSGPTAQPRSLSGVPGSRKQGAASRRMRPSCRGGYAFDHYTDAAPDVKRGGQRKWRSLLVSEDNNEPLSRTSSGRAAVQQRGLTPLLRQAGWPAPTFSGWWQAATCPSP